VLALTNAMRVAPADWKAHWADGDLGSALGSAYPAVPPLRWNAALGASSLAHSQDMASTPCFQHNSCDGTSWSTRIASYYGLSGFIGENIAAGYGSPDEVLFAWACDGSSGACAADGSGSDGHRANLMRAGFAALGVGFAVGGSGTYGDYWTQDFGGTADGSAPPLVDASHDLLSDGSTRFFTNYYDSAPPRSVTLYLDGSAEPLPLALGSAAQGAYALDAAGATACRSYYVVAVDATGASWRYPASGSLRTFGEGGCAEDYGD